MRFFKGRQSTCLTEVYNVSMADESEPTPGHVIPVGRIKKRLHEYDADIVSGVDDLDATPPPDLFDTDANAKRAVRAAKLAGKRELLNELMADIVEVEVEADVGLADTSILPDSNSPSSEVS